ncbi:MAG: AAA family ATPase [Planctomycetota bacterium]
MKTARLIEHLRRPEAYPPGVDEVGFLQTHISLLFFAGEHAYKVKKPLDLGFLDFSSLERRRHFCEEELRLNRRLAPDVYQAVIPVTRDEAGVVRLAGEGETIDWAVQMLRLPDEARMDRVYDRGEMTLEDLDRLVEILVDFHATADTGPEVERYARPEALLTLMEENLAQIKPYSGSGGPYVLLPSVHNRLEAASRLFLAHNAELLGMRMATGRIRDGHGDLHLQNIFLLPDRRIVVFDCIEFTPRFRCADVAADIGFLAMDLDRRSWPEGARRVVDRYVERTGDEDLRLLVDYYKLYFACARGKVQAMRSAGMEVSPPERVEAHAAARLLFELAVSYTLPPALVMLCGLPAAGKSSVARKVADLLGAELVRSDVLRKELHGMRPDEHWTGGFNEGPYSEKGTRMTYDALRQAAGTALRSGRSVVVDAGFPRRDQRVPFLALSGSAPSPAVWVHVEVPEQVTRERMAARKRDQAGASDADWGTFVKLRAAFEPPDEIPEFQRLDVDGTKDTAHLRAEVLDRLLEQAGEPHIHRRH